ncbi:hypothetical protein JST97_15110 [bacterium]|nr:hypothetical protein [bacterium]
MKKTLTLMCLTLLAAAAWAQQPSPSPNDGTLPGYEQPRPGWVNGQDATTNPGANPNNAPWNQGGGRRHRGFQNQNGQGGGRGKRWARFDTNGDGQLDSNERANAKAQMMKRFDTDGDGQLSQQEREAIRAMRAQRGGGKRHRGQFNNGSPGGNLPSNGTSSNGGPLG